MFNQGRGGAPNPSQRSRSSRSAPQSPENAASPPAQRPRLHPASTTESPSSQRHGFHQPNFAAPPASQSHGFNRPAPPLSQQLNAPPPSHRFPQYQAPASHLSRTQQPLAAPPPSSARSPTRTTATLDEEDDYLFPEDDESFVNTFRSILEADEIPPPRHANPNTVPWYNVYGGGEEVGTFRNRDFVRSIVENHPGALVSRHWSEQEAAQAWLVWTRSMGSARAHLAAAYGEGTLPFPATFQSWPPEYQPPLPGPSQPTSSQPAPSQPAPSQPGPSQARSPSPDCESMEAGPSSVSSSPQKYESRPVFAMVPLSLLTPSTMPDLSPLVRQTLEPGTEYTSHSRKKYYAVSSGHLRTIVATWEECSLLIRGHHHPVFKGFRKFSEAVVYLGEEDEE